MNGTIDDHLETKEDILNAAFEEFWESWENLPETYSRKAVAKVFFKHGVNFVDLD